MISEIKEWSQEEAEKWFKKIEEDKGIGEWFDIDWKETTCFEDTVHKKNTTQRAVSGFANTYGGKIVIGFDKDGVLCGFDIISDIENHLRRKLENKIKPHLPSFKVKTCQYKNKNILVIFIAKSKIPLQCDNGVYYYRDQSEFLAMPHSMLEKRFRENFDEEKFLFLVRSELKQLINYSEDMRRQLLRMHNTFSYKISVLCTAFLKSGELLYHFYKKNKLLQDYERLSEILRRWCIDEMDLSKELTHFKNLKEDAEKFSKKLEGVLSNNAENRS